MPGFDFGGAFGGSGGYDFGGQASAGSGGFERTTINKGLDFKMIGLILAAAVAIVFIVFKK